MILRSLAVLAAALLLAGCGGAPAPPVAKAQTATPSTASPLASPSVASTGSASNPVASNPVASNPVASEGRIVVSQKGTRAKNVWYLRIERADASTVIEKAFPAEAVTLDRPLPRGEYRVIAWRRACSTTCPTSGENGLGALKDVCGGLAQITTGQTARVEMAINPDGSCGISQAV